MKTILLAVALLLSFGVNAATFGLVNNTGCDIIVNRFCFDQDCNIISVTPFLVPANASLGAQICGPHEYAKLEVYWADPNCADIPAVMVDAAPTAPLPCGTGTFNGTLLGCEPCRDATVTFDPGTYQLTVN